MNQVPLSFWKQLKLKPFVINERIGNLLNLWGLCSENLNPTVLTVLFQHVSLSVCIDNFPVYVAAIYASTSHVLRRQLWLNLANLQQNYQGPWCYMGDFNAVLGSHEQNGNCLPLRASCDEFQAWTDCCHLTHLNTRGSDFTWSNGRKGRAFSERKLDRTVCNNDWIAFWNSSSCCTLPRSKSDHHPLLLIRKRVFNPFLHLLNTFKCGQTIMIVKD